MFNRISWGLWVVFLGSVCFAGGTPMFPISGRVVDCLARPVANAEVAVYQRVYRYGTNEQIGKVIAPIARTDTQGYFSLQAPVTSQYNTFIVARKPGWAMAWDGLNYNGETHVEGYFLLVLEKPCAMTGRVIDHQGTPVAHAQVQAVPKNSILTRLYQRPVIAPVDWFSTQTDEKGVFRFNAFSGDVSADFWVRAASWQATYIVTTHSQNSCGFSVDQEDIELVLPSEGGIQGRVINAITGAPVDGVKLIVKPQWDRDDVRNRYRIQETLSDPNGWFVFAGVPMGSNRVQLAPSDQVATAWLAEAVDVNVLAGIVAKDVELALTKGGVLISSVRDNESGDELAGIRIETSGKKGYRLLETDDHGQACVRLDPGQYKVYASGKKHAVWRSNGPLAIKAGEETRIDIELDRKYPLQGVVVGENGAPVPEVAISVHLAGDQTLTDDQGHFSAGYDARLVKNGLCVLARDRVQSRAAFAWIKDPKQPVTLTLKPALTVRGRVVDPNDRGIPAARISLHINLPGFTSREGRETLSDAQGWFEIKSMPPQEKPFGYSLSISVGGYGPAYHDGIKGEPGQAVTLAPFKLMPANMSVSGTVVDPNTGLPVPRMILFLNGAKGVKQHRKTTATNEKGEFSFTRICAGPLYVGLDFASGPYGRGSIFAHAGDHGIQGEAGRKVVHAYKRGISLLDQPLPELTDLGFKATKSEGKPLLLCFFDMEQRPSRHFVSQLLAQLPVLREKGVVLLGIQAAPIYEDTLTIWQQKYAQDFTVKMVGEDPSKTRFRWGVKGLPWLILTDKEHVVQAESFNVGELSEKLNKHVGD